MVEACLFLALLSFAPIATREMTSPDSPSDRPALRFPTQTMVDGTVAHYLRSPCGEIEGVVLDGGAVAIFPPGRHVAFPAMRKGDRIRARGDVVGGFPGPILLRASLEPESGLLFGMALRAPHDWPEGLPADLLSEALTWGRASDAMTSPARSGRRADDVLLARHPRLQQRTRITRTAQWLKRLTSGENHASDGRFSRRQENRGP